MCLLWKLWVRGHGCVDKCQRCSQERRPDREPAANTQNSKPVESCDNTRRTLEGRAVGPSPIPARWVASPHLGLALPHRGRKLKKVFTASVEKVS